MKDPKIVELVDVLQMQIEGINKTIAELTDMNVWLDLAIDTENPMQKKQKNIICKKIRESVEY